MAILSRAALATALLAAPGSAYVVPAPAARGAAAELPASADGPCPRARTAAFRGTAAAVGDSEARAGASSGALLALAGAAGAAASRASRPRAAKVTRGAEAAVATEEAAPPPFDPAAQLGATAPLGFFDPLGFCKVGDEGTFRTMRSAEMKHGRVAMMASVGAVAQAAFQFPGFEKVPKGLGAVVSEPGVYGFVALVLVSGALELTAWKDDPAKGVDSIGDFGNPFQLGLGQPLGESVDMRNRELNNGRAAMIAVLGIIVAELATGKNALEQLA